MTLAFSTRWLGVAPFSPERLIEVMRALDLRDCVLAAAASLPPPLELANALSAVSARAVAIEVRASGDGATASLASPSEAARLAARRAIDRAVAVAREVRAPVVILAPGTVDIDHPDDRDAEVRAFLRAGNHAELERAVTSIRRDVDRRLDACLERVCRELFGLCRTHADVRFALVTPRSLAALPTLATLGPILAEVGARNLGYWHDASAAALHEAAGAAAAGGFANEHAGRALGAYLSDAAAADLFLPPGAGRIDFRQVLDALPSSIPAALDVEPRFPRREIELAVSLLRSMGF